MNALDVLRLNMPELSSQDLKIHLATSNGTENPLDVYLAGKFSEWQSQQSKRNFERRYVLSLIALPGKARWLFAGVYEANGCTQHPECPEWYSYQLEEVKACAELNGRMVIRFERPGRNSYLDAQRWEAGLEVVEIMPERMRIAEFPGYRAINITKQDLNLIVGQEIESWKVALSSVAGVYVISDQLSGQLYVGSASGEGGIWQRWCDYAANGHGGNKDLKDLARNGGVERSNHFRYSVLEIADLHESQKSILQRESHWKVVLMTREYGLNSN